MPYAAVIVVSCAIGLTFSVSPMFFSTLSVFLKPISEEFGWGRTQVVGAVAISTLAVALCAPIFGRLIDRYGPRRVILVCTVLMSAAIALMAATPRSHAAYLTIAALIGIFGTGTNTFVYLSILPRWFGHRFGMSLGFAMVGIGLGQAIAPVYANWLVHEYGWRAAYVALGVTTLVVTLLNALLLLRDAPATSRGVRGLLRDDADGMSFGRAVRTIVFWRLFAAFCLITCAVTGCSVHIVPLLTDRGVSAAQAAGLAGLIGVSVLVSRFVTGFLLDYVRGWLIGLIVFAGSAFGIVMLLSGLPGWPVLFAVLLCGASLGVEGDLIAYIVREVFGIRSYGAIYGMLFSAFSLGVVIGPLIMGASFDATGSYDTGMQVLVVSAVIAALLLIRVTPPSAAGTLAG